MIEYVDTVEGITPGRLEGFFVGWPKAPSPETHLRILKGSAGVVLAVDSKDDRVVGFINAVSDGILSAYLPLLEVLPEYKGQGIGGELVRRMITRLKDYYMIDLVCDADMVPFYEKFGLKKMISMSIRRFDRQSGR